MTSALEGGEWSASRPGRTLPPGKTRYPLYRRLGGPQGRSGQVRKISPPQAIKLQMLEMWRCTQHKHPEDRGSKFLRNVRTIYETTRRHIPEKGYLLSFLNEGLTLIISLVLETKPPITSKTKRDLISECVYNAWTCPVTEWLHVWTNNIFRLSVIW
jgi:hypothetical protein